MSERGAGGRFAQGHQKVGGRQKGGLNKFTTLKNEFVAAYEENGWGRIKLAELLNTEPKVFFQLFRDLYPKQVEQQIENSNRTTVSTEEAVRSLNEMMAKVAAEESTWE
jgi:hypothetical protein